MQFIIIEEVFKNKYYSSAKQILFTSEPHVFMEFIEDLQLRKL